MITVAGKGSKVLVSVEPINDAFVVTKTVKVGAGGSVERFICQDIAMAVDAVSRMLTE